MPLHRSQVLCPTLLILFVSACGPIPGGTLSGSETQVPSDWTALLDEGHSLCEIEARPSNPHSIQLDCFLYENQLHVQSHRWALASWWPVESWAAIWIQYPRVRLRVGQQIFEVEAELIGTPVQRNPILDSRGYDPVPDGIVVFRFIPRSS